MKKKITIIGSAYPYRGGIAASNERLAYAFQAQGHRVDLQTFSLQYPDFLFPGKTQYATEDAPENLQIYRSINSMNPLNWWQTGRKIAQQRPDVVICRFWLPFMGPCFGTIGRMIKKNKHTQFITIADNIIPHEKRIGDKQLTQYFVNTCDGFIAMSKSVLEELAIFTDSPHKRYIPHPIYDNYGELLPKIAARQWLGLEQDDKVLLFFGLVRKYKGLDILLEAMADERIKQANIKLMVVGEYYDDKSYYEELINKYQLQNNIISKPQFIPNEEVRYYFCAADMLVQPYKTATQSGISQMAYHFERPMLVSNVGGLPEIVPHGVVGYVVPPTAKEVADSIMDFYQQNKEATFTQNVAEQKKQFSWERMVDGVLELEKVIRGM